MPLANATICGIPEISFTENIEPDVTLLEILNNCPVAFSKLRLLSSATLMVIATLAFPVNTILGCDAEFLLGVMIIFLSELAIFYLPKDNCRVFMECIFRGKR